MSFGYSIGDLIGGANMTYKLIRIMSDTRGACVEYQEAMAELCAMQQAFIQVSQMSAHNASDGAGILPLATVNSASFIVMSSMDTIAAFLERTKRYQRRLSKEGEAAGGSGGIEGSWCKMGWALFKKEELRELRDSLHARLASINTLLTAAHQYVVWTPSSLHLGDFFGGLLTFPSLVRRQHPSTSGVGRAVPSRRVPRTCRR